MSDVTEIFGGDDYDLGNNVEIDELESERQTVVALYIDSSGSMKSHETVVPGCIDIITDSIKQSKSEDEFLISVTHFNENVKRSGYKNVADIDNSYKAGGLTSLYDAIVGAQLSLMTDDKKGYIDMLRKGKVKARGIFVILSDGEDTSSTFSASDARKAVEFLNKKEVITVYIGFGKEACGIGEQLGFANCLNEKEANAKKLRVIFDILSKSINSASKSAVNPTAGTFFQV